jgi:hypothetical protein
MVVGLDRFREHFKDHTDRYVLIGGVATQLALHEAGLAFRPTKDLDIVLLAEALDSEFVGRFWEFVRLGEYTVRERGGAGPDEPAPPRCLYRFKKPRQADFPAMLELFSRVPDSVAYEEPGDLVPIPADEDISSLSAVLLDKDYYSLVLQHRTARHGLPVLAEAALIPLKARAWIDLSRRKAEGQEVDAHNIRKHATDILRLSLLLSPTTRVEVTATVRNDMSGFLAGVRPTLEERFKVEGFGKLNVSEALARIAAAYGLA